jgi:tripartite-type tricarboxylate transporter receptor subunit TctC
MKIPQCVPMLLAVALAALPGGRTTAAAQDYPSRPITMVVSYPPGGPTDTLARILAERMRLTLAQPVIVENLAGAGGSIGTGRVARAPPDGYTLSKGDWNTHVANGAVYTLSYDVFTDFAPVALIGNSLLWLVGRQGLPANDLKELIAWLKANPQRGSLGTVGIGSAGHICGIYFESKTGTRFNFVPYRGGPPAYQDLVAGRIDLMCTLASATLPYVQSGKIKPYAVLADRRWSAMPEVPTIDEAGVPGLYASFWQGLWAPKGTPAETIAKVNGAVVEALTDPDVRQRLGLLDVDIPAREQLTPEALGAYQRAEIDRWWPIIKAAGIKAE